MQSALARKSTILHPLGVKLTTPLLIPSFSSKGFGFDNKGNSYVATLFDIASGYLTDTMLVSAYDLHYRHLEPIENAITEVVFVDSGGYEVSNDHDLSTIDRSPVCPKEWNREQLKSTYDSWPHHVPAVFVNYDHPEVNRDFETQIEDARSLFANYDKQLNTLLLKPESPSKQPIQIKHVYPFVEDFGDFDIVGFTEKEIGNTVLKRMEFLADLRLAMDDKGVTTPIHVFGSLDPISTVLYFLSGAEVFDGLTWLRYGYANGQACYVHNYGVKYVGVNRSRSFVVAKTMIDNLSYLINLTHDMRKFLLDREFSRFRENEDLIKDAFDMLRTKNDRVKL